MAGGGNWQTVNGLSLPVVARNPPPEGFMFTPFMTPFSVSNYTKSQSFQLGGQSMSQVRTLMIDNSQNALPLDVYHGIGNQFTRVPAAGGAFIPTASSQGNYSWSLATPSAPVAAFDVGVALYNYEIPPAIWGTQVVTVVQSVEIGVIVMWYGSPASIPYGYGLCDGSTYVRSDNAGTIVTPNLTGQFVLAASASNYGSTGGSDTFTQANLPNIDWIVTDPGHFHGVTDPGHFHAYLYDITAGLRPVPQIVNEGVSDFATYNTMSSATFISINTATADISVSSGGSGDPFYPPYYALVYMMKI